MSSLPLQTFLTHNFISNLPKLLLINASNDHAIIGKYCIDLFKHALGKIHNNLNITTLNVDRHFDFDAVLNALKTDSLFDETNLIILNYKTKPTLEHQNILNKIYPQLSTNKILIITTEFLNKKDLATKWISEFNNYGTIISINDSSIAIFIKHFISTHNLDITNYAINFLIEQNINNVTQLFQELQNISLYFKANTTIDVNDISAIALNNSQYDIYKLSHAYLIGDLSKSITILDNIYTANEDAILINWMISEDIKKLIKIKAKLRYNNNLPAVIKECGVWGSNTNAFNLATKRINYQNLLNIYNMSAELDLIIKGLVNKDVKTQIQQIIIKITHQ